MTHEQRYSADEFASEARYLDTLVWEALGVAPGSSVLFCGYGTDAQLVTRAIEAGASVTVIEHRDGAIARFTSLQARLLRGSTSVIPAKENTFDLAIAAHYLHEVDPFFHAQVLSELARVARRIAVIEPAPPSDPLGKRIALLYSQAKREFGQFEYYQPLEYWKKLLHAVKAEVTQHVFAFAKVPPCEYLDDTIELLLDTMAAEQTPREDLLELRQIAARSDLQLLPPARYVLLGCALGALRKPVFTPRARDESTAAIARMRRPTREGGYEFPPQPQPASGDPAR